jgi:CDP-6-deoxy-D-xylo-4-hexulose-3-dehydrase
VDEAQKIIDASQVKVRAIFPIHPLGYPIDHTVLENFSKKNSLILINDVCESLGSFKGDTHGGVCGLASSFSFYFSHHITTMEGGGVATNEDYLADELRSIRSHGWSRDRSDVSSWTNNLSGNDSKFLFVSTGFNIRPMEIQAAIGIKQIEAIDSFIERRISIAAEIFKAVQGTSLRLIGGEYVNNPDTDVKHSWMMMPLIFEGNGAIEKRRIAVEMLEELDIETRPVLTGNFLAQPSIRNIGHDFPEPESPVITTNLSRGISSDTFFKLWVRAPRIRI